MCISLERLLFRFRLCHGVILQHNHGEPFYACTHHQSASLTHASCHCLISLQLISPLPEMWLHISHVSTAQSLHACV